MSGTQPNSCRRRPMLTITLSPEATARLDAIATRWCCKRSQAVERLVWEAEMPRPKRERGEP